MDDTWETWWRALPSGRPATRHAEVSLKYDHRTGETVSHVTLWDFTLPTPHWYWASDPASWGPFDSLADVLTWATDHLSERLQQECNARNGWRPVHEENRAE